MQKLRILHVFRAPVGGLFRHVMDVAREQAMRGHDVGIFCDSTTGGERGLGQLASLEPHLNLGIHRVPMSRNPGYTDVTSLIALNAHTKKLKPDVIHGHGSKGGLYARLPAFWGSQKQAIRVYTPHGGSLNYRPELFISKIYMKAEWVLEKKTDIFLFESDFIKRQFYEKVCVTKRLHDVVVNGVTDAEFETVNHDNIKYDILYLGELRYAKGIDTLLAALPLMRILMQKIPRIPRLLLVGSGPDEDALRQQVVEKKLQDYVVFKPPMPIRDALEKARIMVVPSRAESLPYVILEAAAAAQPLVSTDVGGIPEIFGPFGDQLIPANHVRALADAMNKALSSSDEVLYERARELQEYVRTRFTLEHMVDGVLEGYAKALVGKNG
jgi:glycosyltransferase involved in cell wall biosynthesis